MINENDWTRLARYFAGECSAEEVEEVCRWIEADPERRRLVEMMRAAWKAAARPSTSWDTAWSWQRLAARVRARAHRPRLALVARTWFNRGPAWRSGAPWVAVAAAMVLVVGGVFIWRMNWSRPAQGIAVAAPIREVRTRLGERAVFKLGDGTRVILAPASVLRYDTTRFAVSTRELELEGRAFFAVTHDARRPFLVRTARVVAEDLGTEFVITDYDGDWATEVVVASGTVAVRTTAVQAVESATVLAAGELVRLDQLGQATVHRGVDLTAQLAWTEGRLVFADTPVSDVITQLNRWFGIQVRLGSSALAAQRFTGNYTAQPDSVVLKELAASIEARVERHGQIVTLYPAVQPH